MVDDNDDYGDDMVLVEKFIPMQLLFTFHTTMTRRMKFMMWTMIAMMMIRHDIGLYIPIKAIFLQWFFFFNSISIFKFHTNASGSVVPLEMFAKMYAVSDGSV